MFKVVYYIRYIIHIGEKGGIFNEKGFEKNKNRRNYWASK